VNAVLNGEALFERDSILHHRPIACWPLLFALRDLQSRGRSVPSVIDLGGGLGSLYFQHRSWWTATHPVDWNVVELPEIAADGRRLIQEPGLRFFDSLEDAVHEHPPDLVVVASLLAMVPNPEAMMDSLGVLDCRWVFIDRVPVTDRKGRHLIARQVVPSAIYESESPFWFFDESKLRQLLSVHFVIEGQSTSDCDDPAWVEGHLYQWRGYLLRHRRTSP
jgi:putative methyltransferase (TIGR04325 family)